MRRLKDRDEAVQLRLQGMSYSQIKEKLNISKSTLSGWLEKYPLSPERIKELRDNSPRRIENFRETMRLKREKWFSEVQGKVKKDLGDLTERELFIAGLFLYWGEGAKTQRYTILAANTDPAMIKFFIKWLGLVGIKEKDLKIKLHLYQDMHLENEIRYWSQLLNIPIKNFRKPYIKKTKLCDITYKTGFGHGTCNVIAYNKDIGDYIHIGVKYLRSLYIDARVAQR